MGRTKLPEPEKTTAVAIVVNFLLLAVKLIGGFVGRSNALLADAINSLLDLVANFVIWMGRKIAQRPPDSGHRYGHGHADTLAAVFVALTLVLVGGFIAFQAVNVIIKKTYSVPTPLATAVAAFTILTKESLYHWTIQIGRKYRSPSVIANAYDHRSDVYASLGAFVGIVAAQIEWPILDPLAGIWIALFVIRNAVRIMRDTIHSLMSGTPEPALQERVSETLGQIADIKSVRDLKLRSMGSYLIVDVIIQVDKQLTVEQGHDIAAHAKRTLKTTDRNIHDVMVHVEPYMVQQEQE